MRNVNRSCPNYHEYGDLEYTAFWCDANLMDKHQCALCKYNIPKSPHTSLKDMRNYFKEEVHV